MNNWQAKKIQQSRTHQNRVFNEHVNELEVSERHGKVITLSDGRRMVEFVSCSYLGLETHPDLVAAIHKAVDKFGAQLSVARTRIKVDIFNRLESLLSSIIAEVPVLSFNAVTPCHLAVLPLLGSGELPHFPYNKGPIFLLDKTAHATMQINRGLLLQFGEVRRFDFQDTDRLESEFAGAESKGLTPVSISDSVGSMGGVAPVNLLLHLAEKHNGYVYLDDAHGTSVFGKNGAGYVMECTNNHFPERLILVGSLSKAFGSHGGFVACQKEDTHLFIKQFGTTYAFGGPPSLPGIAACVAAAELHLNGEVTRRQQLLQKMINVFDEAFNAHHVINHNALMPIRGLFIGNEDRAISVCAALHDKGFATTVAMFPTVEQGKAMLRCAISANHSPEQINAFASAFKDVLAVH
ncbi:aminotransferase class I/II-fold pyridoxal phosphate-dependent enzyme [Brenneria uluponensis]|uniref:aminotransferase class I/II-fold pyridoxal phosphate-dependent enzyme n=1 Tax=Brenneria uluponensis TaxID=3057057 RepID=UPI0028E9B4BA|nr:aminotransferase class I/II-fold pyridoxal phosphate-dependent enzyme [Brenneria ulupoensis]